MKQLNEMRLLAGLPITEDWHDDDDDFADMPTNMCPDCEGTGRDKSGDETCERCNGAGEVFEGVGAATPNDAEEAANLLEQIADHISELTREALEIAKSTNDMGIYNRAKSYWYGHILTAVGDSEYDTRFDTTMLSTANELRESGYDNDE
jgi:hypothetical protein